MARRSRIGVVTVTFESGQVISAFMDSLLPQTLADFTLYVIDNASSDDTLEQVARYADPRVVVVRNAGNVGVAEGNNIGIRAALKDGCDCILLLNNDTVFDATLLSSLEQGLVEHACDMVVPKINYFSDPQRIWCAGGYFLMGWSSRHFGVDQKDDGRFDKPRLVTYSPTCCMLIRRQVFERIGLMDPKYFVYYDDTDFCYRAYRQGVKLFYVPSARLLHKVGSLTGASSDFSIRYAIRNHVYYFLKHFPCWRFVLVPAYLLHLLALSVFSLRRRQAFWLAQKAFWEGISLFYSPAAG
ncbi:MAG TPA: glycosyltransferase family 2 protein [Terriglobales bacterium]|nr:glycosyltransferase family 2 protein [Terriglobales bacterium]